MPTQTINGVTIVTDETGKIISANTSENPYFTAGKSFLAAAAAEASPATIHQALTNIGAQIPAPVPIIGLAAIAATPRVQDALVNVALSAASGNWVAAAGMLTGVAITGYSIFTKSQLQGVTNDQLQTYIKNLTPALLDAAIGLSNANTSNNIGNANAAAVSQQSGVSTNTATTQ